MIGKTLSHFKILQKIGAGGMGQVYLAEDTLLERKVALKFLSSQYTMDSVALERFRREARAAAALNHPNIITVYEVGEHEGQTFIAMEYIEGNSLRDKINQGDLSAAQILDIAVQICSGLFKAHQSGIVHRDLKPENILIDKDNRVRILDFGLAKLKGASKITGQSSTPGTLHYMSPEQLEAKEIDHRSDIWSLGAILHEMVSGEVPFQGKSMAAVIHSILNRAPKSVNSYRKDVPAELEQIISKTLSKTPDLRYQQIQPILYDLQTLSTRSGAGTSRKPVLRLGKRSTTTKVRLCIASLLFIALFLVVYFGIVYKNFETPPWLSEEASLYRLVSELGTQRGRISPDGKYVAYEDGRGNIKLKTLMTGEVKTIINRKGVPHSQPVWSPNSRQIACSQMALSTIQIYNLAEGHIRHYSIAPNFNTSYQVIDLISPRAFLEFLHSSFSAAMLKWF